MSNSRQTTTLAFCDRKQALLFAKGEIGFWHTTQCSLTNCYFNSIINKEIYADEWFLIKKKIELSFSKAETNTLLNYAPLHLRQNGCINSSLMDLGQFCICSQFDYNNFTFT